MYFACKEHYAAYDKVGAGFDLTSIYPNLFVFLVGDKEGTHDV